MFFVRVNLAANKVKKLFFFYFLNTNFFYCLSKIKINFLPLHIALYYRRYLETRNAKISKLFYKEFED
jgi:hypothetical protein